MSTEAPRFTRITCAMAMFLITTLWALPAGAAQRQADLYDVSYGSNDRERQCEVRDYTLTATQALDIDGGQNGGVEVIGTARSDVQITAEAGDTRD